MLLAVVGPLLILFFLALWVAVIAAIIHYFFHKETLADRLIGELKHMERKFKRISQSVSKMAMTNHPLCDEQIKELALLNGQIKTKRLEIVRERARRNS